MYIKDVYMGLAIELILDPLFLFQKLCTQFVLIVGVRRSNTLIRLRRFVSGKKIETIYFNRSKEDKS